MQTNTGKTGTLPVRQNQGLTKLFLQSRQGGKNEASFS
jgi:hypothetical protein